MPILPVASDIPPLPGAVKSCIHGHQTGVECAVCGTVCFMPLPTYDQFRTRSCAMSIFVKLMLSCTFFHAISLSHTYRVTERSDLWNCYSRERKHRSPHIVSNAEEPLATVHLYFSVKKGYPFRASPLYRRSRGQGSGQGKRKLC